MKTKQYSVKGMHCAACKINVENALVKVEGVKKVEVNLVSNSAKVEMDETVEDEKLIEAVSSIGYSLDDEFDEEEIFEKKSNKKELIKIIVGFIILVPIIFFGMGSMYQDIFPSWFKEELWITSLIQTLLTLIEVILFFKYYKNGFLSIIKRSFNMDSLVFLGSFFSIIYSIYLIIMSLIFPSSYHFHHFHLYYDGAAMILVVVSLGKYIEELSKNKAKSTIRELLALRPKVAHLFVNNEIKDIPTKQIKLNDVIIVNPGETIPVDGMVLSGKSSVDESIISGESLPIFKKEDDFVIGGSVNKEAALKILVNKNKKDNVLNKIASLVSEASNMKTPLTEKVDKVAKIFVPLVMGIALTTFLIWLSIDLIKGTIQSEHFLNAFDEAFSYGVGVLVISCPCALGLATPISLLVGSSIFSKNYILVQKSEGIEKVKDVDALVLDKTNTITEGELTVSYKYFLNEDIETKNKIFTLESFSEHVIAKAIKSYLKEEASLDPSFLYSETIPGAGVKGYFKNEEIYVTNLNYAKEFIEIEKNIISLVKEREVMGEVALFAYKKNDLLGIYFLKDKLKKEAKEFIINAKKHFKKIILLTGDNKTIASYIAKEVGIEEVISEVKPTDKDLKIQELQKDGYKVMMIGDGVNDSIALTRADVGVSISKGSDIAIASASFILMKNNLLDIFKLFNIAKAIRKNIKFNLFWAFIYNAIFIPVAAGCFASFGFRLEPMYCSILMALSSVTVCLNALTLFLRKFNN